MKDYATALWGAWRPSSSLAELRLDHDQIIEIAGTPVGCVAVRPREGALYISRLYVAPDHRNKGIGGQVLAGLIQRASQAGLPLWLEVLVTNPALAFYQRHGFKIERETPERRVLIRNPDA